MRLIELLFGAKHAKPDPIAEEVQSAREANKEATDSFAGLMSQLIDENRRIRETFHAPIAAHHEFTVKEHGR